MDDNPAPARAARGARPGVRMPDIDIRVSSTVGRLPLSRARIAAIAHAVLAGEGVRAAVVTISCVSPARIARLNRTYLGHAGPTDILTFEHTRPAAGVPLVGDIYLAPAVASANARHFGGTAREEVARLVVHGILHTLGWEHPEGESAARARSPMWRRQERWVTRCREVGLW